MGKIPPNGIRFGLGKNIGYVMIFPPEDDEIKVTVTAFAGRGDREDELDPDLFQSIADEIRRCQREYGPIETDEADMGAHYAPLEHLKVNTPKQ